MRNLLNKKAFYLRLQKIIEDYVRLLEIAFAKIVPKSKKSK